MNIADDKSKCDFYFPGIYMKDEMVVGITASGLDHHKAKKGPDRHSESHGGSSGK